MIEIDEFDLIYDDSEATPGQMYGASSDEVLVACLNKLGRVDIPLMSKSSGKSAWQLVEDLGGSAIFQDPEVFEYESEWSVEKGWLFCAQYCSGNVNKKLETAKRMNKKFKGRFDKNITALKKVLPNPMSLSEVHASPGVLWVSEGDYSQFAKEIFELEDAPVVTFSEEMHKRKWRIESTAESKSSIMVNETLGTPEKSGISILEDTMNGKTVKVYDYIPRRDWRYEPVLNKEATLSAQEKQNIIISKFDSWIRADAERAVRLEENYNDMFVCYGTSNYDGSFLQFPDINPDVEFYPHQRSAIAHILLSDENLLLAQDVGAGKTFEICAGVHELYRMNISRKNLIVSPNNVMQDMVLAYKYLYPNDKILVVSPADFTPKNRQSILETIRDGDFYAIFMAYSSFDLITMSKNYWLDKMSREIKTVSRAIANSSNKTQKSMLERQQKSLSKKYAKYLAEAVDTPWLPFEQLGIKTLVVDESHNYKNIPISSNTDNIVGMHNKGSEKCKELLEKSRVVDKLIFATGTPTPNSLADMFALQTYLQPDELRFRGIDNFDIWANTFSQKETNFEIDVDGKQLRLMTRFSKFHNLTELISLLSNVCNFYHIDENDESLPVFDGYVDVLVPKNEAQDKYIKSLSKRTDLIRERKVKRTEDNLLKVTIDGRKCALDIRLVDPFYCPDENEQNKITACADKVFEIYRDFPDTCQAVFSDIGTPKSSFNVYDELKYQLVKRGIPAKKIAFIHDATTESARSKLFAAINAGTIRVVIGSTAKLGVGVNMQERLIALHHLSVPWRPADMVQREGRIIRRGNKNEKVKIYRYITAGSFDAYSWQLLQSKQRFISDLFSATSATRDADDVADAVLNYAEVKALAVGNPNIKRRLETENLLEGAKINFRKRQAQLIKLRTVVDNTPAIISRLEKSHRTLALDAAHYACSKTVIHNDERLSFGEELLDALATNVMQNEQRLFDSYQGFDIYLPANMDADSFHVCILSKNGGEYYVDMKTDKPLGCAMKIDRFLDELPQKADEVIKKINLTKKQEQEALADIENGNCYEAAVDRLQKLLADIDKQLEKDGIAV